ncbi:voltage-dependent anion channel-domain-containing protein [Scheffersomyces amazonensis]|uniref:voltage-dependent anion channel-domain-containing protein n=1 Tax=Scheffersomyces amazonensis TaxID=1078765 RepID=UPI00315C9B83
MSDISENIKKTDSNAQTVAPPQLSLSDDTTNNDDSDSCNNNGKSLPEDKDNTNANNSQDNHDNDSITLSSEDCAHSSKPFATRLKNLLFEEFVEKFTPVYFVSIMGTGISSNILYNFGYPAHWLRVCGIIMFVIAVILFLITSLMFLLSCYYYYPKRIMQYNLNPNIAVFMGCYAMGYITLINFIFYLDKVDIIFVWVLWWIAIIVSVYTAFITVFFSILSKLSSEKINMNELNSTLLLPIVAITVVSSSGHIISPSLKTLNQTLITEILSLILWCISIALAFIIITIYYQRLILHKIPSTQLIFTSWLPVGFLGQSSFSIMMFGKNMYDLIEDKSVGNIFIVCSTMIGVFLLSFGYFNTFLAVISTLSKIRPFAKAELIHPHIKKGYIMKFNKAFWSMTFPLGTMALSNNELGKGLFGKVIYPLKFFRVLGCIYSVALFAVTIACLIGIIYTCIKLVKGLFRKNTIDMV